MNNLLLLEDDISLIDGLQYSLNKNGFHVDIARTVEEAKNSLTDINKYDLLILDVTLPDGTGFDVCEKVRKQNTQIPIILSTGMSTIEEIRAAIDVLKNNSSGAITLLHCTTAYPAPYDDINLRAMQTLRDEFNCEVGYSDHTMGYEIAIAAVALGANVIEKHFTLDRNMIGPDHKASLEPEELKRMIFAIRHVEKALGSSEKRPSLSEVGNMQIVRKSIVAKRDILKGEILSTENITTKRPGSGISPMRWYEVIGTLATRDFKEDDLIEL